MPVLNNIVHIHIPKTGGTSIEIAMDTRRQENFYGRNDTQIGRVMCAPQHYPPRYLKEQVPDIWDSAFKFTFVRNPYDRVLSEYMWLTKFNITTGKPGDFLQWIHEYYSTIDECHKWPQSVYFKGIEYDFIGRLETIEQDWEILSKIIGVNKSLPHHNKSEEEINKDLYLTPEAKASIEKYFKEDFDLLQYD